MNCPSCGSADAVQINDYTIDVHPFGLIRFRRNKCAKCGRVYIYRGKVEDEPSRTDERSGQEEPAGSRAKTNRAGRSRSRKP